MAALISAALPGFGPAYGPAPGRPLLPLRLSMAVADTVRCYDQQERRAVIAARKAIPLARAVRAVGRRVPGETVRAELCEADGRLTYRLTILSRNGRVTRATVDAVSGQVLSGP